jgi:hypothetical protein
LGVKITVKNKITYRLAEYKVIENELGDFWWETHFGFGSLRIGKCFINGNILFIKQSDSTEPGFLIGEFLDHLNKLPKWEKTKYYCTNYKIYECKSVLKTTCFDRFNSQMKTETALRKIEPTQTKIVNIRYRSSKGNITTHGSYKLGRYEIIEKNNGQLFWKTHGGLRGLISGRCYIEGNILILERGKKDLSNTSKREFIQQLIRLPDWKRTDCFCTSCTLYYSETGSICRRFEKDNGSNVAGLKADVVHHKTPGTGSTFKPIILSNFAIKDKFKVLFHFCNLSMMQFSKLMFGFYQIMYKAAKTILTKGIRFRG